MHEYFRRVCFSAPFEMDIVVVYDNSFPLGAMRETRCMDRQQAPLRPMLLAKSMVEQGAQSRSVREGANDALQPKVTGEDYPQRHMQGALARNRNIGSCGKTLTAGGAHLMERTGPPCLGAARRTSAGVLRATGRESHGD